MISTKYYNDVNEREEQVCYYLFPEIISNNIYDIYDTYEHRNEIRIFGQFTFI